MSDYTDQQIQILDNDIVSAQKALRDASTTDADNSNNQAIDTQDAIDDVRRYYGAQLEFRGYAGDAQQVVNDAGVFGLVANQEVIDALGQAGWAQEIPNIAVQLAAADDAIIDDPAHATPTENQIADYHYSVYHNLNIDPTYWGGATGASLGLDWAGGTLNAAETDPDLSKNNFYGTFS